MAAVQRLVVVILAVALLVGCNWDGPARDVRVVPSSAPDGVAAGGDATADGATGDRATAESAEDGSDGRPGSGEAVDAAPSSREVRAGAVDVPDTVAVVGDSLTVAATDEITAALAGLGVRTVVVDGRESRRMASGSTALPSGVAAIEQILTEHRPDLWVVALGTNDVGAAAGPDRFRADLRATLAAIPVGAPLAWVDVWIRDHREAVVEANGLLHAELGRRRAPTSVVDWFTEAAADGVITGDGVHLTPIGETRFADAIADAVADLARTD